MLTFPQQFLLVVYHDKHNQCVTKAIILVVCFYSDPALEVRRVSIKYYKNIIPYKAIVVRRRPGKKVFWCYDKYKTLH